MNTSMMCPDAVPNFLRFFDLSVAPPLLFYAYLPAIIVALFFGFYIYKNDNHSLQSKLLLGIAISFSIWVLNLMFQWTIAYVNIDMFSWQITPFFEIMIPIFAIYFVYVFLYKKDIPLSVKIIFSFFILILAITLSTPFNTISFDYQNCEANYGNVYYYFVYVFELLSIFIVGLICLKKYLSNKNNHIIRKQAAILGIGSVIFLTIFYLSNILGEYTKTYEINLFGPIGILAFVGFISFMIVKYGLFNTELIATEALVVGISILIGSQLLFPSNIIDELITIVTLCAFLISGFFLIRSVKREIEAKEKEQAQRERIEELARNLEIANKGQENLIHVMNHQIKGFLGKAKNIFGELLEGDDYGHIPDETKVLLDRGLKSMDEGVRYVQAILKGASAQSGTLPYEMKPVDIRSIVTDLIPQQKEIAENSDLKLTLNLNISEGNYRTVGDELQLIEVFKNLITNAIKYNNPKGSIDVELTSADNKIIFAVKDTGDGVSDDVKSRLFTAGGISKDSIRRNPDTSGYGLAFVKGVAIAHKGKVGYRPNTDGKGSVFYIELPIINT